MSAAALDCPSSFQEDLRALPARLHVLFFAEMLACCDHILHCSFRWPRGSNLSEEVKELIQSLLKRNPQERPSAKQLLSHSWVRGSCPAAAQALLVAGKKLLEGSPLKGEGRTMESRGDSPLVQQLIADARSIPTVLPWPDSPGTIKTTPTDILDQHCNVKPSVLMADQ